MLSHNSPLSLLQLHRQPSRNRIALQNLLQQILWSHTISPNNRFAECSLEFLWLFCCRPKNRDSTKAASPQQLSFCGYQRQRNLLIPATRERISFIFSIVIACKDS